MDQADSFRDLIRRVRSGDDAAAWDVVQRYESAIRRAARIRLADSRLRRLFDSVDICQSVFASFFFRAALGQYELESPEQLLKLLVNMTRKKFVNRVREEHAAKRDCRRLRISNGNELALQLVLRQFQGQYSLSLLDGAHRGRGQLAAHALAGCPRRDGPLVGERERSVGVPARRQFPIALHGVPSRRRVRRIGPRPLDTPLARALLDHTAGARVCHQGTRRRAVAALQ